MRSVSPLATRVTVAIVTDRSDAPLLNGLTERACSKLEKVGLRYARKRGRPLVLIFNSLSRHEPCPSATEEGPC